MKVELLGHFGGDLMVANVARVSYEKEVEQFGSNDVKLLHYLAKHQHTSPFRHPQLQFRIECPIYVERQLRKHEIGLEVANADFSNSSINSISGRYVDFHDRYEQPLIYREQSKNSKQGSAGSIQADVNDALVYRVSKNIEESKKIYQDMIELGVSKEQARCHLPLCLITKFIWTGSLLSFIHLFNLRLKPDAQKETRDVVQAMFDATHNLDGQPFKHSLEAMGHGKQ